LDKVLVGKREQLTIQCRDKYNNTISKGGDWFLGTVIGLNLSFVDSDNVQNTIQDMDNGKYTLEFAVAYEGFY
jgi:hypothetical protein